MYKLALGQLGKFTITTVYNTFEEMSKVMKIFIEQGYEAKVMIEKGDVKGE